MRLSVTESGKGRGGTPNDLGGGPGAQGVTRITSDDGDPIANALRRLYDDAAQEPLPEDLSRLLSQLEAAENDA